MLTTSMPLITHRLCLGWIAAVWVKIDQEATKPMENQANNLTAVDAQDGQSLSVVGDTYRIIVGAEQTGGAYSVIDMLIPPQGGPGPHSHADYQEAFYVVEGEIVVKTEARTYTARQGSFVNIPQGGIVHDFKNLSDTTAHLLCLLTPAGMEGLFREIGKPVAAGAFLPPPPMDAEEQKRLQGIAEKYGQKLFPPDYLG